MLTAEHTGWVKDYRAVLLTMESLEATAFTAADWRGIIHLQDLWPSVHSTKEGKRRPPLGYYTRYAYLAAAWRTLRLDSALHIELDVILTATLSELCAATGWPDAYGRARLDATAACMESSKCSKVSSPDELLKRPCQLHECRIRCCLLARSRPIQLLAQGRRLRG